MDYSNIKRDYSGLKVMNDNSSKIILPDFFEFLETYYKKVHPSFNKIGMGYWTENESLEPFIPGELKNEISGREIRGMFKKNERIFKTIIPVRPLPVLFDYFKKCNKSPFDHFLEIIESFMPLEDDYLERTRKEKFIESEEYGNLYYFFEEGWDLLSTPEKMDNIFDIYNLDKELSSKSL